MTEAVLGVTEAICFWDDRHQAQGELTSGGDLSFDHAGNEIFYALRIGLLIELVGDMPSLTAPRRILDAGCGKGVFGRAMGRFGHRLDGIDSSEHAIARCRAESGPRERYFVSTLDAWTAPYLYDVVYCVDVLFHIMDDAAWERSVRNLASLVSTGGLLAVVDHGGDEDRVWSKYQKTRASSRYDAVLESCGMRRTGFLSYRFRGSPAGFHTFVKVG